MPSQKSQPNEAAIDKTIQQHLGALSKPGVLTVRPGFEIAGHQLTGKTAIVATVHTKTDALTPKARLPNSIAGIPVDVREATAHQRLRAHDPLAAQVTQIFGRQEDHDPVWPLEREMPSGRLLTGASSQTQKALKQNAAQRPVVAAAVAAHQAKLPLKYVPAPNTPLVPVSTTTTITAHVSPDAGFVNLQKFLSGTQSSLVIGMYDFTSGPILELFKKTLGGAKALQMVLDNPPLNDTADQSDGETVLELNAALAGRSKIMRALSRSDKLASAWMFPFAYHIKVIVRDNSAFWLSSGNLNDSNQPDPTAPLKKQDRDWHLIVEDPVLAKVFAAYLNQDFQSAAAHQVSDPVLISAVTAANTKLAAERTPPPPPAAASAPSHFAAKVFANVPVRITPLLTPDLLPQSTQPQYATTMTRLISSAQQKLYVQLQYIEASSGTPGVYESLLQAIAGRVAAGVDVRLIENPQSGEKWAEKMKSAGVDLTANIAMQANVHNKGFVIDSRIVVVSSQNFSPAGVETNRDAGVIIENSAIAQYYEQIFLSDWTNRTFLFAPKAAKAPTGKPPAKKARKTPAKKAGKRPAKKARKPR